jgi:hypothetical protein
MQQQKQSKQQQQPQASQPQASQPGKYIAPNNRQQPKHNNNNNNNNNNNQLDKQSFPTLTETLTPLQAKSFASVAKKVEVVDKVIPYVSDVKPGWVHIRRHKGTGTGTGTVHKGTIQFKYNMTNRNTSTLEDVIYEEKRLGNYLFTRRVTLQQEERDIENEMLGDLSPFWNTKTISEMHEDADFQEGDYEEGSDYSDN